MPQNPSQTRRCVVVTAAVVACYLLLIAAELTHGPLTRGRWIAADDDVTVYFERAQFLPLRAVPYRDVFSEYPPLATLAFTVPMLVAPAARPESGFLRSPAVRPGLSAAEPRHLPQMVSGPTVSGVCRVPGSRSKRPSALPKSGDKCGCQCAVRHIRSITEVFRSGVLAIYSFVTFSRIDSPQWLMS